MVINFQPGSKFFTLADIKECKHSLLYLAVFLKTLCGTNLNENPCLVTIQKKILCKKSLVYNAETTMLAFPAPRKFI